MRALTLLLPLGLLVTRTNGQQVANPGFEADTVGRYTYMTPTGWSAGGGVVVVPSGSGPWGGLETPDGSYYVSVQGSGAYVEQTLRGLSPGTAYNVQFWAAERPGYGKAESMRVVVDGVVVLDSSHPPETFSQLTAVFVASASTAVVRFENDSPGGDNSFFVDAVSVTPAPGGGALSCEFEPGDGIGGTETHIGDAQTAQECMQMVHQEQPGANGATYSNTGGTACYAEFGMTGNNGNPSWQTCLLTGAGAPVPPPPPNFGFEEGEVTGCRWMVGPPTDGTSTVVGTTDNGAACATLVSQQVPTATAASFYLGGGIGAGREGTGECSAVTGMTATDESGTATQTCLFIPGFCDYVTGDGQGGTEAYVADTATAMECVNAVLEFHPDANGATYASDGNACYAEFGMTGPNDSEAWHTCLFPGEMSLCTYEVGDGVGGTEESLGNANSEMECVSMVRQMRPDANGATYSARGTGTSCYAEFGMAQSNGNPSWQTCLFDNAGPDHMCGPGDTIRVTADNTALQANGLGGEVLTDACVFPFTYGDVTYNSCTTADFGDVQWCSLSATYGEASNAQGYLYGICDCAGASSVASVAGCTFIPGDGTGGDEAYIGDTADAQACATLVVAQEPEANGATYSNTGGTACYAEFGQTGSTCPPGADASCSSWQNCIFSNTLATTSGCVFGPGDGTGGTEANVGDAATAAECTAMVLREQPDANGVTFSNTGGTGCYAEFGMTGSNDNESWQTCMLTDTTPSPPPPPSLGAGCAWTSGDGVGEGADAHEQNVGEAPTPQACVELVQQTQPDANGATYRQGGTACYAEFGMSGRVESSTWQTCVFETAGVGCAFAEGDGTGGTEEYLGDTDTPNECVSLVHSTRPDANGVTYSNGGGAACYAEFGATGSTGAPSSWQTCVIGQGGNTESCADSFSDTFSLIQSTCCTTGSDCDHGTPATCNSECSDLVTDFWRRCEAAVADTFGESMHNQLAAFARVCARSTGGPPPPPPDQAMTAADCAALAATEIPSVSRLCCKNRECGVNPIRKCSRACADAFVPFFTQCGALSYPASSIQNLAQLSQTCIDRHPGAGSGSGH